MGEFGGPADRVKDGSSNNPIPQRWCLEFEGNQIRFIITHGTVM